MENAHGKGASAQKLVARARKKPRFQLDREAGGPHPFF